jgi:hypothetical protein
MQNKSSLKSHLILSAIASLFFFNEAFATNIVSVPYIRKDVLSLQYRSTYDFDSNSPRKDNNQPTKLVANYGFSKTIRMDIKANIENKTHEDAKLSGFDGSIRWQFLNQRKHWLTAAIDGSYTKNTTIPNPDQFEGKLILGKRTKHFEHLFNISGVTQVQEDRRSGIAVKFAWQSVYKLNKHAMPGFEIFSNSGNLRDKNSFQEQSHQAGPALTGAIYNSFNYNIAYLYGLSNSAIDQRVRLILFYAKKF